MEDPEAQIGVDALRSTALTLHYALPDLGTGINPNWPAMGYPGPQALPKPADQVERPIEPIVPDGEELTLDADVVIVGSGAGGGVIAGELSAAGKRVCVLEMGGYHDESEFNGLELWAYQNLFLNQGPFPTAEGQINIQAGSALGGGTVLNWTNCLRTTDRVRAQWAGEHGHRGGRRPRLRRAHGRGLGASLGHRRMQRPERAPQPAQGGLRRARLRLEDRHPQHRPRQLRPGDRRIHGLRRRLRLEAVDPEDLPRRRRRPRRRFRDPLPGRANPARGRAGRRGRGELRRSRGPHRQGRRPRAAGRRRLRLDRVAGAAAALRDRRPGGRRLPPPSPDLGDLRLLRGGRRIPGGDRRRRASHTSSRTSTRATASCSSALSTRPG